MKSLQLAALALFAIGATAAQAANQPIDLSGASGGTVIVAPGASFAQTFAGQTVSGTGVTGSPTGPLALAPSGTIDVAMWDPFVSPVSNSLLSQPGNSAPLSILFDTLANSFTFTMGSSSAGSTVNIGAYDAFGILTGSMTLTMGDGYNIYTLTGLGTFKGLTFSNDNDPSGVRFQNMSYNSVGGVPEPATWAMMLIGFGAIGLSIRAPRRKVLANRAA